MADEPRTIKKILIANRGEIAVRVMRACRDLGIQSVAVFSEADSAAYHVRMADEAYPIGPAPSNKSYLVMENVIEAAKLSGADAVHPGYGFLSENASFARRCEEEGIIFIGPKPDTITALGDKVEARRLAIDAGLPVVPGTELTDNDPKAALDFATEIGFPVLIKAAAGGGGKGMRVVESPELFEESLQSASNEALNAFGNGTVFVEKYLLKPRHVEIQIMADHHGNVVHLNERECSIQRRHQKVIEESPSPIMTPELRERMGNAAIAIAKKAGYVNAGTCEFLVDQNLDFYFLEVNTRLQVEHPVTEMITGLDLVREQIWIAEGREMRIKQEDVGVHGHALECRIYAEDPEEGFAPSTGRLKHYRLPQGPGVRVDSGVVIFSEIPIYYDPMIAKLAVWGRTREEAIARTQRALQEYRISGVKTTIGFHRVVLDHPKFIEGDMSTGFLGEHYPDNNYRVKDPETAEMAAIGVAIDKFVRDRKVLVSPDGQPQFRSVRWKDYHRRAKLTTTFGGNK